MSCTTPAAVSGWSNQQYNLSKVDKLPYMASYDLTWFQQNITYDNNLSNYYDSTAQNCFIQLDFGSNSSSLIDSIKFIPRSSRRIQDYEGLLIQANQSGNWVTLFNLTQSIMQTGWTTFYLNQSNTYQQIRFISGPNTLHRCQISEIEVYGINMINFPTTQADDMACPIYISSPALTSDIVL